MDAFSTRLILCTYPRRGAPKEGELPARKPRKVPQTYGPRASALAPSQRDSGRKGASSRERSRKRMDRGLQPSPHPEGIPAAKAPASPSPILMNRDISRFTGIHRPPPEKRRITIAGAASRCWPRARPPRCAVATHAGHARPWRASSAYRRDNPAARRTTRSGAARR